jgi:hypothetical protein
MNQRKLVKRAEEILENNYFISTKMKTEIYILLVETNEALLNGITSDYTDLEKIVYVINFLYASNAFTEEETDKFIALLNELEEGSYKAGART